MWGQLVRQLGSRRSQRKRPSHRPGLRVEQLEPRVVLTQSVIPGPDVVSGPAAGEMIYLSLLQVARDDAGQVAESSRTWTKPRQLPGSKLRQYPPSDLYSIEPAIMAGDPDGSPPDSPENRIDSNEPYSMFAGVGSLRIQYGENRTCTATAIGPSHVLTAAHCLDLNADGSIDPAPADVEFNVNISGATTTYTITANQLFVHPDWTGFENPSINDDIAVIELSEQLPEGVPYYALNEVPFDEAVSAHLVGYGRSGDGINGYTTDASYTVKRWGKNEIDTFFVDDEGSGVRETFQFDFDAPTSGDSLGNDIETTLGEGDSGGPAFINDTDGSLLLFGVNTYRTQFDANTPAPPYFGSGGGGMVVSAYLDFINSVVNGDTLVITQTDGATQVAEDGEGDSYFLSLGQVPSHNVVVDLSLDNQLSVTPTQLIFTPSDWDVPQEIHVEAIDDALPEGPHYGMIKHVVSSSDVGYDGLEAQGVTAAISDDDWSLETTPYVDLGPSDNVAWDQPRAVIQLLTENEDIIGPSFLNTWLLDTGANTTIAFRSAVEDMVGYETEGKFIEYGVAGPHEFDISAEYRVDWAGRTGERHTLHNERIISDPFDDISIFGPYGIIGMPAMSELVTTFDFTPWTVVDPFGDILMRVYFSDTLPADPGDRYSIPTDTRITFDPTEQVVGNADPPMWADVPFLTAIAVHEGVAGGGNFIYDSGAQLSVMSTRVAEAIGLDSNGDGVLDHDDANFARYETVGGIGGTIDAPVFLFDEVRIPTEQGVDMVWTDLQWLVLDIAEGLDGVIGFDLMTSGWIEAFAVDGQSGYIMQAQLDFRGLEANGVGTVHLDLNPDYNAVIDPTGPGARVVETGGATTVSETGVDDTYEIMLTKPPTENVTVTLKTDSAVSPTQVIARDAANPANDFLVFTPANWFVPQTVVVSAIDDGTQENFHRSSVRHISSSADPNYEGVGMPRVIVNVIDDDYPGVMIIPTDGETEVVEGGRTDTYDVVLTYPPSQNVTFRMEHEQGQLTAVDLANPNHSYLVFTPENWNVPQTVLVTAVDDEIEEGTHRAYVSHFLESGGSDYSEAFALQEEVTIREAERAPTVDGVYVENGLEQRSMLTKTVVMFSDVVSITDAAAAFRVTNVESGTDVELNVALDDSPGRTLAFITFAAGAYVDPDSGSLVDGNYELTIDATKVLYNGLELDGDADGIAGGDFVFGDEALDQFFRLFGDADSDRDVDNRDFLRFRVAFRTTDSDPDYKWHFDFDGDGDVDNLDFIKFRIRFRNVLPF